MKPKDEAKRCKEEWEVKKGRRRGGRRISKRMSELLGRFGEENEQKSFNLNDVNPDEKITNSKVNAKGPAGRDPAEFTASFGTATMKIMKFEFTDIVTEQKTSSGPTEGCDWLAGLPSPELTANRDPVRKKRKWVQVSGQETKRRRVGSN